MNLFKQKTIPSGETIEIKEYERWSVRWVSLCGSERYPDQREEANFFTSESDAQMFKEQLRKSQEFLKQKVARKIEIIKED